MIETFANVIKLTAQHLQSQFPLTWEQEMLLRRSGKLVISGGYCHIPAWQQVSTDCSAVSVAAAIQKLLVKSVYCFGYKHPILAPHPAWLYAVARNQISKESSIAPGCKLEDVIQVVERYGVLWMMDGIPPYTLEVVDAWTDSIHYKKAGLLPSMYSQYFERFLPVAQKLSDLVITKIPTCDGVLAILNGGGTVVIESDMPFEPQVLPDKRKIIVYQKRNWAKHVTYLTDIDNNFHYAQKKIAVARWQIWGDAGEHGEYKSQHATEPSGMGWQPYELLATEFSKYNANAYGFVMNL
jgi:hypothetical protein